MTYLNIPRGDSHARNPRFHQPMSRPVVAAAYTTTDIESIEKMVAEGRQGDLARFFSQWDNPPSRMGEWEIRVNVRSQDNTEVSRTVVALPLTVRARSVFEKGCIATLRAAGYTEAEAGWYYKAAWKKKYIWIDAVISATKDMIDAYQTTMPLDNYEKSGDPRRLAASVSVPKNPYLTSHAHFLVAVEMAKYIVKARIRAAQQTLN